jgi:hypothetical protein
MTETTFSRDDEYVEAKVIGVTVPPLRIVPESEVQEETFTHSVFEDALDRVSRSVQGKYADVMPSTEEFIRQRREEEAEVEDREQ